jgi:hypothetical protein
MFKDGRTNIHDEEWSGRSSVVIDDHAQIVDKKIVKDGALQFQNFLLNFHKLHWLFSMRLSHSRVSQILRKMASENAHGWAQNAENGLGFDFYGAVPQRWR